MMDDVGNKWALFVLFFKFLPVMIEDAVVE